MEIAAHTFRPHDLVGGHVVVDLVNTVNARDGRATDWLDSYARVLEWAALTGHFDQSLLDRLRKLDEAEPSAGTRALRRLRDLRETVHDVLAATIGDRPAPDDALRRLERHWKDAVAVTRLTTSERHARLQLSVDSSGLDYLTHELALQAFDLVRTFPEARTRVCAGPNCGWLFIDRSKAGRRRWCDMATCGNAAKSRRHYERKRAGKTA